MAGVVLVLFEVMGDRIRAKDLLATEPSCNARDHGARRYSSAAD